MARDVELNAEIARVASKFLAQNFPIVAAGEPLPKEVLKARWRQMLPLGWTHILDDGPNEFSGASQIETLFRTWGAHPAPGPAIDMFVALPTLYRRIPRKGAQTFNRTWTARSCCRLPASRRLAVASARTRLPAPS